MITDIFSSFDPFVFRSLFPLNTMFLITNVVILILIQTTIWISINRNTGLKLPLSNIMYTQLSRTRSFRLKGFSLIISAVFLIIITINLIGLIPYIFRTSRHLVFTLTIGLPAWIRLILSRFIFRPKKTTAHFLPDGAPDWLNPFLVLIETTRVLVRPLTLSFRLAANISAGHIVLRLIGIYCSSAIFSRLLASVNLSIFIIGYVLFEIAICLIQAYIFCLLLSLYSDDHAH
jgi:ATP synthase subunit 6